MTKSLVSPSYIIVLGTTYSGSGAIYDYLSGRGDLYDPLKGVEYQLPHMPNGLMALESVTEKAFHPSTADYVLSQFEDNLKKLLRPKSIWHYGRDYEINLPSFQETIKGFLNEICAVKISMKLNWHRLLQSPFSYIVSQIKDYTFINEKIPQTRLLVSQNKFVTATKKLHDKIFQVGAEGRPVLLNQAGSGWNPIESTKYFSDCRIVLVTRDPRDQFLEIKQYKKATSVLDFIDWYKEMRQRLKKIKDVNLIQIQFEDFVCNNDKMVNVLCDHMSLSSDVFSKYEADLSKINIGKYKKSLTHEELNFIEYHLSEYIYAK